MRPIAPCAVLLAVVGAHASGAVVHRVFVTSTSGTAKLSTWGADAGGQTGVDAGDAICQARADDAGIDPPGTFKAWLSTDADDAFCRIQGLSGEKGSNCGQGAPPNLAGPWTSLGGLPFGAKIEELVHPTMRVYSGLLYNEFGNPVGGPIWTGTFGNGAALLTCGDWESESDQDDAYAGATDLTGVGWTAAEIRACDLDAHLLCMEVGVGDPLPPWHFWGRLAFVTSASGDADLGAWPEEPGAAVGLDAADAICRNQATQAGLPYPESFKAWLSDSQTDVIDRFEHDGPFIRLDRIPIARDLEDLFDGHLDAPINQTENGDYLGNESAWTSSTSDGLGLPPFCEDWTDVLGTKIKVGNVQAAHTGWAWDRYGDCNDLGHLYCLQDLPLVFGDGFESGTTGVWSQAVPN